jgi:LacI family transcriptional regulator
VARRHGAMIFAGSVEGNPQTERALVRAVMERRADALVMASSTDDQSYLVRDVGDGTPVVFVHRAPVGFAADSVGIDNVADARRAIGHLAEHGHRRVAYLGDLRSIAGERDRHTGFGEAMNHLGLQVRSDHVARDLHSEPAAEAAVGRMLMSGDPPTALFATRDDLTIAAVRCLRRLGLEHQVALVGFGDFPLADLVRPGVTVMAPDPNAIGRLAGEIVFSRLAGDDSVPERHVVPSRLLVRGSGEIRPRAR